MSGFAGRTHAPETRAKMRAAKVGVAKSPECKARIAESLRRWHAEREPWQRRRGWRKYLSDEEAADLTLLRSQLGYSLAEALVAVGRGDLVEVTADKRDS